MYVIPLCDCSLIEKRCASISGDSAAGLNSKVVFAARIEYTDKSFSVQPAEPALP